jgi:hypothetical protein
MMEMPMSLTTNSGEIGFHSTKISEKKSHSNKESKDDSSMISASEAEDTDASTLPLLSHSFPSFLLSDVSSIRPSVRDGIVSLLHNSLFSDVTLTCTDEKEKKTKKIAVHRAILAQRSPVFAALFKTYPDKDDFTVRSSLSLSSVAFSMF